jgi:hypothetical protein
MSMSRVIASETEEAYFRSDLLDKRHLLMGAWAKFCSTLWERFVAKADSVIALCQWAPAEKGYCSPCRSTNVVNRTVKIAPEMDIYRSNGRV